ncbi:MAG: hypothetical protein FWF84_08135 [Kiritimatiellaeota bacterium]|nr:hypothetical protein [Kiritimatiellota bacterium]
MKLHSLFSDHAVLQRNQPIPVWGWTKPRLRLRVTIAETVGETVSDAHGAFMIRLPAMAAGGPYTLAVTSNDPGEKCSVSDILVGEVWVCSGQSNMQWTLDISQPDPDPKDIPAMRMFTARNSFAAERAQEPIGAWSVATREAVPAFSGVGYFFGRALFDALKIPVGLINTAWGGTRVEAWMSREELMLHPDTREEVEAIERDCYTPHFWARLHGPMDGAKSEPEANPLNLPTDPGNGAEAAGWAKSDFDDGAWQEADLPRFWKEFELPNNGVLWFRRTVNIPKAWVGKALTLNIGAVDKHDITYVNGVRVGATGKDFETEHWNVPRTYRVPAEAVTGERLTLAVRALSFAYAGGMIGPAEAMSLLPEGAPKGEAIPLAGAWRYCREHDYGVVTNPAAPYGPYLNANSPHVLFDNLVASLVPYAIKGAIWYQGESNENNARAYEELITGMITDWRRAWGQGDFPFAAVQLAGFYSPRLYDSAALWPYIREANLNCSLKMKNVGYAPATDVGDANDIHPTDKRTVGLRLARWALVDSYGAPGPALGPRYVGYAVEGNAIRLRFDNVGGGLVAKNAALDGVLTGFVIAGANRAFRAATATIDGNTLRVSSPEVPLPVSVRYAWSNNPTDTPSGSANLFNAEGLPASPFRTDAW